VLSSSGFARNERLSGFLRFLVERHRSGEYFADGLTDDIIRNASR
jgi:hypothetical protein